MRIRWLLAALSVGVVMSGALVAVPAQAAGAVNTGEYRPLINAGSGKCLTLQPGGGILDDGVRIVQETCDGTVLQRWRITYAGQDCIIDWFCQYWIDVYQIENAASGKCIDLRDGGSADWTPVQQWTCVGHPNMEWAFDVVGPASFALRNRTTEYHSCLDVEWGSHDDGAPLQGFHCTSDNLAQTFYQG
jgi:hypothetical protein